MISSSAIVGVAFVAYLTAATFGLSSIFSAAPELYLTVKLAGAGYLAYLAPPLAA